MEKFTKNHYVMFAFIAMGLAFSGYLSGVKLFSDTCAFGSSCPIFLGYPACYTGFIVYAIIALIAIISLFKKELSRAMLVAITGVSFFGVLFSGKLTLLEMSVLFEEGLAAFVQSLPLCSVGLIVYIVIFILSLIIGKDCTDPCCSRCSPELPKEDIKTEEKKEVIPAVSESVTMPTSIGNEIKEPSLEVHVSPSTEAMPEEKVEENNDGEKPLIM
jgi:hypothetical protein